LISFNKASWIPLFVCIFLIVCILSITDSGTFFPRVEASPPYTAPLLIFTLELTWTVLIVGAVVCFYTNNSSNKLQKHRRQSWLSQIGWNDRLSYSWKGIKIAVIDTGVDSTVSELNTAIIEEKRIVHTNENNDVAHGTAICGIIAGEAKDENQAMGIAKDSRIISIDVIDDENGIVQIEHLIKGLNYAIEKNVDIINISVGCLKESKELKSVINKAIDKDIIVIASGGNYMENNVLYPAQYD